MQRAKSEQQLPEDEEPESKGSHACCPVMVSSRSKQLRSRQEKNKSSEMNASPTPDLFVYLWPSTYKAAAAALAMGPEGPEAQRGSAGYFVIAGGGIPTDDKPIAGQEMKVTMAA
ncbi:hypothetical protein LEMLEM_LOCUS21383 [Lemmus lemmus]